MLVHASDAKVQRYIYARVWSCLESIGSWESFDFRPLFSNGWTKLWANLNTLMSVSRRASLCSRHELGSMRDEGRFCRAFAHVCTHARARREREREGERERSLTTTRLRLISKIAQLAACSRSLSTLRSAHLR